MIKIAIVTRSQNSSPKVLAESLAKQLLLLDVNSKIFYRINAFKRLLKYSVVRQRYPYYKWFIYKMIFFVTDRLFIHKLKTFDAIIISDCSPLGFFHNSYDIERLHEIVGSTPIIFYEVYYLGNAPTVLEMLKSKKQPTIERYNWHLSVTDITEIKNKPAPPWSQIGIYLKGTGLRPNVKKQIMAVVDFAHPGNEQYRNEQIQALEKLNIPYISLEKRFTISEIRSIYQQATFYFMQSLESFGLPIAECLCCGNHIFTPDSSWPMAWRLDENPKIYAPGSLPECFVVYSGQDDLETKLKKIKKDYDFTETPQKIFEIFFKHYPTYYEGNQTALKDVLRRIELKKFN